MHVNTELLHGAYAPEETTGATALPIFQSASFAYETAEELEAIFAGRDAGYVYSRINNPTLDRFERRMTVLEDGLASVSCSSGMAAISTAVLTLAGSGDEIVSGSSIFGGTYSLFAQTLPRYGITTRFVETTNVEAYQAAVTSRTKLIFVETVGNPKLDVPDIAAIAAIAKEHGIVLMVDNTVTTPVLCKPKALGADIVVHSTSKCINGHGNAIGGIIVDCGSFDWSNPRYAHLKPFYDRVRNFAFVANLRNRVHRDLGGCFSPFNAFLMSIGIESLAVRMERHCTNAARVAETLSQDTRVDEVRYPGLPDHPDYSVATRQFSGGFGPLLTLRLGTKDRAFGFINALQRAQNLANLGDAKTLVVHPASTFCRDATEAERQAMGVTDDLVRLSIGIEHVDDILEDIEQALNSAS
ncbi:MAG: aminotransferase class I/II-fold pyridoxal phosphate-dependent enzyme [Kiritimatiellia bacterium]|jgi:O-acetylhomoserine (thiol)-lyase|nr:aminotransferase class I/II-fold pyridoxal phosphate-dependent enzyme [Kiritimatiellia bacterium]MDP6630639.1 aminotransferase class I/II-fold pyridoxal phosphate-dependent enzyme [Kiritimatiellia bacterium]MDP6809498.1 aminotransferase class I/II-fold pyridoxal phosphate-dependent enzyme [Kiritimatiellia bacterium]MDP7023825.1 aminotransferase class I/II-fold pyridoxal phosphate-dependent enzyme [Kiritimatiellia bacterium]